MGEKMRFYKEWGEPGVAGPGTPAVPTAAGAPRGCPAGAKITREAESKL